jgi:hypothetical protein
VDWNYTHYIQPAISIANKYGFKLGCYEGGQQLTTNAGAWSSNPDIYTEYTYMLNKWKPANFVLFNHYTLYGAYSSGGAWGAKADATQTTANSPKYHALIDWMSANPATQASGRDSVRAQATAETDPVSAANRFSFSVFPNPAFRSLTISLLGLKEQNLVIRLVSLKGSVLREQTVKAFTGNNSYRFSLGSVSSGLYFIDVLADGRSYVKEVMVR